MQILTAYTQIGTSTYKYFETHNYITYAVQSFLIAATLYFATAWFIFAPPAKSRIWHLYIWQRNKTHHPFLHEMGSERSSWRETWTDRLQITLRVFLFRTNQQK